MARLLQGYHPHLKSRLITGFTNGFQIPSYAPTPLGEPDNHKSVYLNIDATSEKIQTEIDSGRVAGPFDAPPFQPFYVSPLGLIPKKSPGEWRLIQNLSFPKGTSVNDCMSDEHKRVSYEDFDHVMLIIQRLGRGCWIAKSDMAHAFKLLPVDPESYKFLGFKFKNKYFYDKTMVMGAANSCSNFELLSSALQWILANKFNVSHVSHILDDFQFFSMDKNVCASYQTAFHKLCQQIGVPIKHTKTVYPCQVIELHGLKVDTQARTISLPEDKTVKAIKLLTRHSSRKKITLKELQSLIGVLSFATRAVEGGRAFLRRLIDLTIGVKYPNHHIRLNNEARKDMEAWLIFLNNFNGILYFRRVDWDSSDTLSLFTDSSNWGFAAVYRDKWTYGTWPHLWSGYHITVKEMYPIMLALALWAPMLANRRVIFVTDNQAVAYCIRKQTSKDSLIMRMLRSLIVCAMRHNIVFTSKWISTHDNTLADLLSRNSLSQARVIAPWLQPHPEQIPQHLMPWKQL